MIKTKINFICSSIRSITANTSLTRFLLKREYGSCNVVKGEYEKQRQIAFSKRSHNCNLLTEDICETRVNLSGWIQNTRFDNKIVVLRDSYGSVQCILNDNIRKKHNLSNETVVQISGTLKRRGDKYINPSAKNGLIEVHVDDINILNQSKSNLPILIRDDAVVGLETRLRYRYLELRRKELQEALKFRSKLSNALRNRLHSYNFIECETPTLLNRTPGGANEFIVPSRDAGKFFSLVQSPQQLKQLLMIGGVDRYFQFARCYRDEDSRADRQPEFTQLDIELAFTSQRDIYNLVSDLMKEVWSCYADYHDDGSCELEQLITDEIPTVSYNDCFKYFGTDKPDMRFDSPIMENNNNIFIRFDTSIPEDILVELVKISSDKVICSTKLNYQHCDNYTVISIDTTNGEIEQARKLLGAMRQITGLKLNKLELLKFKRKFSPLWVTDFPLFIEREDKSLDTCHHPFTAPTEETIKYLYSRPVDTIGQNYDLVLNGHEIAGGSIRIHKSDIQRYIFDLLDIDSSKFQYFLEALESGCPPHGGIAFGFDRLCSVLLGKDSIRDVLAFPKSSDCRDLMIGCPEEISDDVKLIYHLK